MAAALALGTIPANAAVVEMTFTGTITSGADLTDTFGTGTTNLAGQSVTMVVTYDTEIGTYLSTPTMVGISGGSADGVPSPASAEVTIGGVTQDIAGDYAGAAQLTDSEYYTNSYYKAEDRTYDGGTLLSQDYVVTQCQGPVGSMALDLTATYSMDSVGCSGYLKFYAYDGTTVTMNTTATARFTTLSMRVIDMAPIPLPAGFGLLGAGLAALGGLGLRRKRR